MVYVMSRSIAQGRMAGMISLAGVMFGYLFYMFGAAFGITAFFLGVPYAGSALGAVGALYLFYLAWQAVKPGGRSPWRCATCRANGAPAAGDGATTSLLNPKLAMIFLSLLPQFIDYQNGSVLRQSLALGSSLIVVFATVNGPVAVCSGSMATLLSRRRDSCWPNAGRWALSWCAGHAHGRRCIEVGGHLLRTFDTSAGRSATGSASVDPAALLAEKEILRHRARLLLSTRNKCNRL